MNIPGDELRELYAQFEHELSLEATSKYVLADKDAKMIEIDNETRERIDGLGRRVGEWAERLCRN